MSSVLRTWQIAILCPWPPAQLKQTSNADKGGLYKIFGFAKSNKRILGERAALGHIGPSPVSTKASL